MKSSRRIQNDNIPAILLGILNGRPGYIHRVLLIPHGKHRNSLLLTVDLQLLDRRRTVNIAGNQKRVLAFLLELSGNLGRRSGLTSTLETCHEIYSNLVTRLDHQLCHLRTHQSFHLFFYYLNDHLPRIQSRKNILSNGTVCHCLDECLDHAEIDIRFQQSTLHFLHGLLDIGLGQTPLASQILKDILKFICKAFKCHKSLLINTVPESHWISA